jgi:oxygen-independent coproporphyrinogen-3 oxidase
MTPLSIYIHIPFCRTKCLYCDFLSFSGKDDMIAPYLDALCTDIAAAAPDFAGYKVVSVFFGGGTPTVLTAAQLGRVFNAVADNYRLAGDVSVTTEANPETVDFAYLSQLRQEGFNRISFGVQSFDGHLLEAIGRIHSPQKAVAAVNMAARAGFADINIDLIYALPHQTSSGFAAALEAAVKLPITHISCYALTVEEGTSLAQNAASLTAIPDEATDRQMYHMARKMLAARGFTHYEISNWARDGFACRHNMGYWIHRQYMGFGVGAHSFVDGKRICKIDDLAAYINGDVSCRLLETVDKKAEMAEFMMLGLRLMQGIDINEFAKRFDRDIFDVFGAQLKKFKEQGLLNIGDNGKISLTPRGIDISNTIFAEFL